MVGQAVNQVGVDGGKPCCARGLHQCKDLLGGLNAVHRLLHGRIKVLYAEADAGKAQLFEVLQALRVNGAGVYFNGVFAVGVENEKLL